MKRPPRGGVTKSIARTYPANWDAISSAVRKRDGDKCTACGRTRAQLAELAKKLGVPMRLETHHISSVRTMNNNGRNLRTLCTRCHSLQPGHSHLRK